MIIIIISLIKFHIINLIACYSYLQFVTKLWAYIYRTYFDFKYCVTIKSLGIQTYIHHNNKKQRSLVFCVIIVSKIVNNRRIKTGLMLQGISIIYVKFFFFVTFVWVAIMFWKKECFARLKLF